MSKIDAFNKAKELKDAILHYEDWSVSDVKLRIFHDDGRSSSEGGWTDEFQKLLVAALSDSEHHGASLIFHGATAAGAAIKSVMLRYLNKELARLASKAKHEAEEVLATIQDATARS